MNLLLRVLRQLMQQWHARRQLATLLCNIPTGQQTRFGQETHRRIEAASHRECRQPFLETKTTFLISFSFFFFVHLQSSFPPPPAPIIVVSLSKFGLVPKCLTIAIYRVYGTIWKTLPAAAACGQLCLRSGRKMDYKCAPETPHKAHAHTHAGVCGSVWFPSLCLGFGLAKHLFNSLCCCCTPIWGMPGTCCGFATTFFVVYSF